MLNLEFSETGNLGLTFGVEGYLKAKVLKIIFILISHPIEEELVYVKCSASRH